MGQLEAGKLDTVANNFVKTTECQKKYNFTDAYLTYATQIVTSVENKDIQSLDDLKGKTVSGVLGSTHVTNLRNAFPNNDVTIRTYETRDGAMNDVINNRFQGYVNSRPILLAEINKRHLPLKLVGDPIFNEQVTFPFAKTAEGDKLLAAFNQKLQQLRQNGQLRSISAAIKCWKAVKRNKQFSPSHSGGVFHRTGYAYSRKMHAESKKRLFLRNSCFSQKVVGERGFEPPTHWSQTSCATKLRYSPKYFFPTPSVYHTDC